MRRTASLLRAAGVITALGLALSASARAAPTPFDAAADRVVELLAAGDEASLRRMASERTPDPWMVTHVLVARGKHAAAVAYAVAAPDPIGDALEDYWATRPTVPIEDLQRVRDAAARFQGGDAAGALAALAPSAPEGHPFLEAMRLGLTARIHGAQHDAVAALRDARAAADVAEQTGWFAGATSSLGFGAAMARRVPDPQANLDLLERAYDLYVRMAWPDRALTQRADLANAKAMVGDYAGSAADFAAVLPALRSSVSEASACRILANYALVLERMGEYSQALVAIDAAEEVCGEGSSRAALASRRGAVYVLLGNLDAARLNLTIAVAAQRAGGDRGALAEVLGNLGRLETRAGRPEAAEAAFVEARSLLDALHDTDRVARIDLYRGVLARTVGDHETALRLLADARKGLEANANGRGVLDALDEIAETQLARGDADAARNTTKTLLEELRAQSHHDGLFAAEERLARIEEREGHGEAAEAAAFLALDELEHVLRFLSSDEQAQAREHRAMAFGTALRIATANHHPDRALEAVERGRAADLLVHLSARGELRQATVPDELARREARQRTHAAVARRAFAAARDAGTLDAIRAARRALEEAEDALALTIGEIQRTSRTAASLLYPQVATADEIRAGIGADELLVEYAVFDDDAYALVLDAKHTRIVPLGSTGEIEKACAALPWQDPDADPAPALAAVAARVVTPLHLPPAATRVLLSPDGVLCFFPFGTVLGDREVAYVPSGTVGQLLLAERDARGSRVLALGDPVYEEATRPHGLPGGLSTTRGAETSRGGRLRRLPASGEEAKAVGDVVLLREQATERGLREALATETRWRALHLACHGLVDTERPLFSALALTAADGDDGYLHVHEILGLDLHADLVTLSACDTARGRYFRAEGVRGLPQAFLVAGAPRLLVSLWKVDDEATRVLMERFYALWNGKDTPDDAAGTGGLGAAAALEGAQAYVRTRPDHPAWKHPYYWAAWTLWGLSR